MNLNTWQLASKTITPQHKNVRGLTFFHFLRTMCHAGMVEETVGRE